MGVVRQAQEVQLSVCQMFPENYGEGTDANLILYVQYTHTHTRARAHAHTHTHLRTHKQSVRGRKVNLVVIH